jgi:uncharacterized repeat protein (TIGR01451 family)
MAHLSKLKSISNRFKNFLLAMLFVATQFATPLILSGTAAAANPSADLDQCRNGTLSTPAQCADLGGSVGWVNGNAGASNAHWREGDSIAYRMRFANLNAGAHAVTIQWDTTKSGKHALDYLTTYNRTETTADPCSGVAGCGSPTTIAIPDDPNSSVTQVPGVFTLYNATLTSVSAYTLSGSYASDSSTSITVNFTTSSATPVLAWGGHIASQIDWGYGNSASAVSGSPYHTRLLDLDGKGGNQDQSLAAAAVFPAPDITTQVSDNQVTVGDSVTDLATVTDPSNSSPVTVTGGVDFYLCSPLASAPTDTSCVTGGTKVGATKALSGGQATSDAYQVQSAGDYCFRAEYTPAADAPFSPQNHTNGTTECFHAEAPRGSITIIKDAVPNSAQDFSFTTSGLSTDQTGFKLDDDNDPTLSNTRTFTSLVAGDYGVTESATTGWDFDSVSCTQGASVSKNGAAITIHLAAGENVTCTYKNRQRGTITVHKVTYPANDKTPFSITASTSDGDIAGNATRNDLATNNNVVYDVSQGSYSVDETAASGWSENDSDCTSLTVSYNDLNVECTIYNTKLAKLTIVKQTNPGSSSQSFSFTPSANLSGSNFALDTDSGTGTPSSKQFVDLTPGQNYTVTENGASGWKLTNLTCSGIDFTWDNLSQGVNLNLPAGADVTCTFTNTQLATITGTKFVADLNGTKEGTIQDWTVYLFVNGQQVDSAQTLADGSYSFNDLMPGTEYTVVEDTSDNTYTQLYGWDGSTCSEQQYVITLAAGQTSGNNDFCNFKNGSISGYKFNDLNGSGTKDDNEPKLSGWTINLYDDQDQLLASKVTDGTGYEFTSLAPGTYKVCEEGQAGWTQTSTPECYTVNIDMSGEQNLNINFGNQGRGTITIKKNVDTNGDGVVDQTNVSTWTWDLSGSYINDANYQDIATGTTKSDLPVDAYSIHEDQQTNYHFVAVVCTDEAGPMTVTQGETTSVSLGVGKNVVCTFTNARDTGYLKVVKDVVNDNSGDKTYADFHFAVNGGDPQSFEETSSPDGAKTVKVVTGSYNVTEPEANTMGYTTAYDNCSEVQVTTDKNIENPAVCTITNNDVAHPGIHIVKSGPAVAHEGDDIKFIGTITNTGDAPLDVIGVQDNVAGTVTIEYDNGYPVGDDNQNGLLDIDETWIGTVQYTVPDGQTDDIVNTMTVCANDATGTEKENPRIFANTLQEGELTGDVCDSDSHTTDVLHPAIHVVKSGKNSAPAGSTVTYTFTVTNTGDTPLTVSSVIDTIAGNGVYQSGDTNKDGLLDLDETWIYTADYKIPSNQITNVNNTVTVCANDQLEKQVCDSDSHSLTIPKVLGASTELPNTGQGPLLNFIAGAMLILLALGARWFGRKSQTATL